MVKYCSQMMYEKLRVGTKYAVHQIIGLKFPFKYLDRIQMDRVGKKVCVRDVVV